MRLGSKVIGFNQDEKKLDFENEDILLQAQPEDLLKFGLIPELIGRLPVTVALSELSEDALVRIIKEPKNSIIKQYETLFEMDSVELEVEEDAIHAVADKALQMNTGARGLRGIFEGIMTEIMYEIPSRTDVEKCIITKDVVDGSKTPILVLRDKSTKTKTTKEKVEKGA